ncbi:MAG: ATP-binding protein [Bacteroidota bacterium]
MKLNCYPLVLSMLLMLYLSSATAQKANFEFFTAQDGLSGGLTTYITQDQRGFLWVLNDYKLHRYDGQKIVPFLPPAELPGSREKLWEIKLYQDTLLACWSKKYLLVLNIHTSRWASYQTPFQEVKTYRLGFIEGAPPDEIWLGEQTNYRDTLRIWRFANHQFSDAPLYQHVNAKQTYYAQGDSGNIFLFHSHHDYHRGNQLQIWHLRTKKVQAYVLRGLEEKGAIHDVKELKNGSLLLLTSQVVNVREADPAYLYRMYFWHPDSQILRPHPINKFWLKPQPYLHSPLLLEDGSIWVTRGRMQVLFYDAGKDTLIDYSSFLSEVIPNETEVFGPVQDQNGSVWFGSQLGLLQVYVPTSKVATYFAQPQEACAGYCSLRGITEDAAGFLYAYLYQGLLKFHPDRTETTRFFARDSFQIPLPSHVIARKGKLYLNNGWRFESESKAMVYVPGAESKDFQDEGLFSEGTDGRLWWVRFNRLSYLVEGSVSPHWQDAYTFLNEELVVNEVLHAGRFSGKVFIGREGRLFQYDPEKRVSDSLSFKAVNLSKLRVLAIEEDAEQKLWLATNEGLVYFDPLTQQGRQYTMQDGLPNDFVCGMLAEGDSVLWLSTNHGLSRFSIATESFVNFYEEDGLTHNEFNRKAYFKARDGRMYFGGLRGINAFYPEKLMKDFLDQQTQAALALSAYEYVDEQAGKTERRMLFPEYPRIHIYYHHRSFTFEYALTNFNNPSEVAYSFRMKGYQDTWSKPSKFNFTRFSSLPTGEFNFEVRAKDSHGLWHPNVLSVKVIVHPPWWATWWAYLAYTCLTLALLWIVYRFLSKRWELQHKLQAEQTEAIRLKKLNNFKSKLYTNITHEFRTPLTVILGMAAHIRQQPEQYLENGINLIENNGKQLLRLINQLLDLSKLEDHSFRLQWEQGDLVGYLRYLTESFQTYANSLNLILRYHSTEESLMMDFDPEQVKQIMANLLSNALKFTPSGGKVSVEVSASPKREAIHIQVSDNGIGIKAEDLPFIFDRFYQVDGTSSRKKEGTGIGLAHTRELVKVMHGEITVESEAGQGTKFRVQLPIQRNAPLADEHKLRDQERIPFLPPTSGLNEAVPASSAADRALPQILLMEDNADVVAYLKACLEDAFELDIALNGKVGIEKALAHIPDLVITDVMMPEKDGFEVCERLKKDERTRHIPIIMLTAKADFSSKMQGLSHGADAYLAKPFHRAELLLRVEKLLERNQQLQAHYSEYPSDTGAKGSKEGFQTTDIFMQKVRLIVEANYADEDFSLAELCRQLSLSRSQLYRKMKALVDTSPSIYIRNFRLTEAKRLLQNTDLTVSEVAWRVGFKDLSNFSKAFQAHFGTLPSETRK